MILLLQAIAVVLTIAGAVTFYLGNDPSMLSLGNTLMIVGAIGAVGGLVLFALSVIASRIDRVARGIDTLKLGVTPAPTMVPALRPAEVEPRGDAVPAGGGIDLSTLRAAEPVRVEPPVVDQPPALRRDRPPLRAEPAKVDEAEAARPVPPMPLPTRPVPMEPTPVEAAPVEAAKGEPAVVEPAKAEPAKAETAKVELPPIEPVRTEPEVAPPVVAVPTGAEPAPHVAAEPPAEPPRRMTFRERFGWKSAAATAGAAAAVGAVAAGAASRADERRAEPVPAPEPDDRAGTEPENRGSKSLEEILGGALADPKPAAAVPVPPRPTRVVEEDDLMARLRASILGPDPAPAPAASEPEAAPDREAGPAEEPAEQPASVGEEPKAQGSSIEEELEKALKAALGREVSATPDPRDRFVPPPARSEAEPEPEPEAPRATPPTGEGAMAALARDFPELGDILKRTPPPEPVEPVVIGRDGDEIHDSHAMESVAEEPVEAEPAPRPQTEAREIRKPADAEPAVDELAVDEPAVPPRAAPEPAAPAPAPAADTAPARAAPLLREGVIAGIPFRLYGDGSIEADLPSGTTRFASLRDFRAHVGG